jgi:hypothetical protein
MVRITEQDERMVKAWFRKRKLKMPFVSWRCLVWNHLVYKQWKARRNYEWMLSILQAMEQERKDAFFRERQMLLARNYPKPSEVKRKLSNEHRN